MSPIVRDEGVSPVVIWLGNLTYVLFFSLNIYLHLSDPGILLQNQNYEKLKGKSKEL
jgi:hypothetical protein